MLKKGDITLDNTTTPTLCRVCLRSCGILVHQTKEGIRITGNPKHPVSKGFICFRGANYHKIWGSPQRVKTPLFKTGGKWLPISYEEATNILVTQLEKSRQKYGSESIAFLKGEALKHQENSEYMKHLTYALGSPNFLSIGSMCHRALVMGHNLTYGGVPELDFQKTKTAVLWGRNIAASSIQMFQNMKKALEKGMKLLVIDPSITKTAKVADIHLRITPGSDGYLALAFTKSAIEEHGLAPDANCENGWDDFRDYIHSLSYNELLEKTGIKESTFNEACALIFGNLPCWNQAGVGLELQPNGVQTVRAIACLQSLVDPGTFPTQMKYKFNPLPNRHAYPAMPKPIGYRQTPLFCRGGDEGQAMFLPKAILDNDPYPIRTMFIAGANPALTFPASTKQRDALGKLDFLAVCDLFMTDTAREADLVLPAADFLNNLEIHDYGRVGKPYLGLVRPIAHKGWGWPLWKWLFEMANGLGLNEFFPWDDNEETLKYRLSNGEITFSDLEQSPVSVVQYSPDISHTEQPNSKKTVNYYSEKVAEAIGTGSLLKSSFELPFYPDQTYPFWLSTGDRVEPYQNSQFRQSEAYLNKISKPLVDIHPVAADSLQIKDGERVELVTRHGEVMVEARLTDEVRQDCLRMMHGWEQANVNEVTGLEYLDPISSFPWCRALPAKIVKKC
jgi:anaerobic selenocysteine-containing dehydrogenase